MVSVELTCDCAPARNTTAPCQHGVPSLQGNSNARVAGPRQRGQADRGRHACRLSPCVGKWPRTCPKMCTSTGDVPEIVIWRTIRMPPPATVRVHKCYHGSRADSATSLSHHTLSCILLDYFDDFGFLLLFLPKAGARTTAEDLETQIIEFKQDREMAMSVRKDSCSSLAQHHALSWPSLLGPYNYASIPCSSSNPTRR